MIPTGRAALAPFQDAVKRLSAVPGTGTPAAQVIIAEIGDDMSRFPTAGHLLSWAGLVPRLDESAGKRRSTRIKKGAPWLKPMLVQCAAAARKKSSYFPSPIPAPESASRGEKGGRRGRRLDPHNRLSHAGRWDLLPRSRSPALRASRSEQNRSQTCEPYPKPRLSRRNQTGRMTPVFYEDYHLPPGVGLHQASAVVRCLPLSKRVPGGNVVEQGHLQNFAYWHSSALSVWPGMFGSLR